MSSSTYLKIFGLEDSATKDDIKSAYRTFAKKYHPDINKSAPPSLFIEATKAYNWLLDNHIPVVKKSRIELSEKHKNYYKIITKTEKTVTVDLYDEKNELEEVTAIYFIEGYSEFRVVLPKGMKLPTKILINGTLEVSLEGTKKSS